jgi:hypothetical protein
MEKATIEDFIPGSTWPAHPWGNGTRAAGQRDGEIADFVVVECFAVGGKFEAALEPHRHQYCRVWDPSYSITKPLAIPGPSGCSRKPKRGCGALTLNF